MNIFRKSFALLLISNLAFAQQKPMKIWFDKPAEYFEETMVLGNGRIGATVFGGVESEKIYLNDITLWSGQPTNPDMNPKAAEYFKMVRAALANNDYRKADSLYKFVQGKFSESYAPLGTLTIDYPNQKKAEKYYRELSLDEALAKVNFSSNKNLINKEYLVSNPDKIFAIKIKSVTKGDLNFTIKFNSLLKYKAKVHSKTLIINGNAPVVNWPSYVNKENPTIYEEGKGTRFATYIRLVNSSGSYTETDSSISLKNGTEATILVSIATSFNGFDKDPFKNGLDENKIASENLNKALPKTFEKIKSAHLADYRKFYDRVKLSLNPSEKFVNLPTDERLKRYAKGEKDAYLEALYFQYGRYLLISSSRTPGVPANLQGLWNHYIRPPWSSNYTMNINAEENYWLAENTNLSEMHDSFLGFVSNLEKNGSITAKTFYGANGWTCAHNSDIWAMTNPVGDFGNGDPVWANWNMGGAWAATHLWEHYLFTQDKAFLKDKAYSTMKGAALFCLDMLIEDKNGKLITSPSTSPENKYRTTEGYEGATLYGGTADLAMIRELFIQTIQASKILNSDIDFRNKLVTALAKLHSYQIGKKGNLQEWYYDWEDPEPKHRHQSHLYGLFPGNHINPIATPDLAKAAATSLNIKGDETTGWSKGWRINLWARLLDGDHAYKMYRELLKFVEPDAARINYGGGGGTYPNLFDAHPPFQIDGNFGGAAAVAEMLVQSTENDIYILPALPAAWQSGTVSGLKTRGGFTLDITWKEGKLQTVKVKPSGLKTRTLHYKDQILELKGNKSLILNGQLKQ